MGHTRYYNKEGILLPSVTTVLNLRAKPALIHWAWECGMANEDYRKVRDEAADIGTMAHQIINIYLMTGTIGNCYQYFGRCSTEMVDKARLAATAFLKWSDQSHIVPVASEIQVVSEEMQTAGTIDIVGSEYDKFFCIVDIKSGKGVYDEHRYQVAAYAEIWREIIGLDYNPKCHIVRIDRDTGEFNHYSLGNLKLELECFKDLLSLYKHERSIKWRNGKSKKR